MAKVLENTIYIVTGAQESGSPKYPHGLYKAIERKA